ncbi:MAG: PLP-dependent aminotransferase family protein [Propionibacteriaceae bacterium]|jgi:2-aminoadipate transaminase|nr:PLP-dependent aminotransferase family protein [Propionibacteriaceae bacterium]
MTAPELDPASADLAASTDPFGPGRTPRPVDLTGLNRPGLSWRGANDAIGGAFASSAVPLAGGAVALTGGFPGSDLLPVAELGRAFHDTLAAPGAGTDALQYHGPFGVDQVRAWIAADQGADFDDVLVTNGALHAVAGVVEALVDPGDLVVVEDPTYPFALRLLRYFGARLLAAPTDADGLDVDWLAARLAAGSRPKLVYTIPDFQNPTGSTLAAERRVQLLDLAQRYGFVIVSDNPYVKLRFSGPTVAEFPAGHPQVALANTFSKLLGPGLRLGWLIVPPWLRDAAIRFRLSTDQHSGLLTQRAVARLLDAPGLIDGVVARARAAYAERAAVLHDALTARLGEKVVVRPSAGGLFLWAQTPGVDLRRTLDRARARGLDFTVGSSFDPDLARAKYTDRARFSYSNASPDDLRRAADRFAAAVRATD